MSNALTTNTAVILKFPERRYYPDATAIDEILEGLTGLDLLAVARCSIRAVDHHLEAAPEDRNLQAILNAIYGAHQALDRLLVEACG